MPIRAEMRDKYPDNWKEIRQGILEEAGYKCEECGIPDHAVGYRDAEGNFIPAAGNYYIELDCAREMVKHYNEWCSDGEKWIVIILTVAHLDHNPENNKRENLALLCQQCHNRHDAKTRHRNRRARLFENQLSLNL